MLTGIVKSAFRASHTDGYEPLAVVDCVWNGLTAFGPERFVTLVTVLVAPREGRLTFVNAGHPAGLIWSDGNGPERLASSGPMLSSIFRSPRWNEVVVPITTGQNILLYTDGVSEAFLVENGEDRIKGCNRAPCGRGPRCSMPSSQTSIAIEATIPYARRCDAGDGLGCRALVTRTRQP